MASGHVTLVSAIITRLIEDLDLKMPTVSTEPQRPLGKARQQLERER
jgi:hypothetical protein